MRGPIRDKTDQPFPRILRLLGAALENGDEPAYLQIGREREGMVEVKIQGQRQRNTAFAVGDAAILVFPKQSVDCGLLGLMIGLVSDPDTLIREITRVLKPGGSLIIVDSFDAFYDYLYPWDHRLTERTVIDLVKRLIPRASLEITDPVSYREHWGHSRTVIYDTTVITVDTRSNVSREISDPV